MSDKRVSSDTYMPDWRPIEDRHALIKHAHANGSLKRHVGLQWISDQTSTSPMSMLVSNVSPMRNVGLRWGMLVSKGVSVLATNVKTNIFGTLPVTSANFNKKIYCDHFLNMTRSKNIIIYSFSKTITVRGYAFLIKTSTIFITICKVSHFFTFHEFKSLSRFRNK